MFLAGNNRNIDEIIAIVDRGEFQFVEILMRSIVVERKAAIGVPKLPHLGRVNTSSQST